MGKFFIGTQKTRNFVFFKQQNGIWTTKKSSASNNPKDSDFQIKFGVIENRNDVTLVFEDKISIPLFTKDEGFYFGFTIFPPDNKPYNFRCTLFSPDEAKLSNETGEIIEEIASSVDSKQQFFFPARRAEGITTMPMWLDKGDPVGEYRIELFINDELIHGVDFSVYQPK